MMARNHNNNYNTSTTPSISVCKCCLPSAHKNVYFTIENLYKTTIKGTEKTLCLNIVTWAAAFRRACIFFIMRAATTNTNSTEHYSMFTLNLSFIYKIIRNMYLQRVKLFITCMSMGCHSPLTHVLLRSFMCMHNNVILECLNESQILCAFSVCIRDVFDSIFNVYYVNENSESKSLSNLCALAKISL